MQVSKFIYSVTWKYDVSSLGAVVSMRPEVCPVAQSPWDLATHRTIKQWPYWKYTYGETTLLRKISSRATAWNAAIKPQIKGRKGPEKDKWNYKRKSINTWKKNISEQFLCASYCAKCIHLSCPLVLEIFVNSSVQFLVQGRALWGGSGHYWWGTIRQAEGQAQVAATTPLPR